MLLRANGYRTLTIANGATASEAFFFGPYAMAAVIMPSTLDGTALTFQVSGDGVTYVALDDGEGAAVGMTVAASKAYALPDALAVYQYFKLVMGTSQTDDSVIGLCFKS